MRERAVAGVPEVRFRGRLLRLSLFEQKLNLIEQKLNLIGPPVTTAPWLGS